MRLVRYSYFDYRGKGEGKAIDRGWILGWILDVDPEERRLKSRQEKHEACLRRLEEWARCRARTGD